MADLPRFRKGRVGGLDFSQLNELLNRTDSMKTTTETAGVKREADAAAKPVRTMLVNSQPSGTVNGVEVFDWEEIMVRGDYQDRSQPLDKIVEPTDSDYELLRNFSGSQIRYGTKSADTYAISTDPSFAGGVCFCLVIPRTDGRKRYVLVPTGGTAPRQQYVMVTEPSVEMRSFGSGPFEEWDEDTISMNHSYHRGRLIEIFFQIYEPTGVPFVSFQFVDGEDVIDIFDFSIFTNGLFQLPSLQRNETNIEADVVNMPNGFHADLFPAGAFGQGFQGMVLAGYTDIIPAYEFEDVEYEAKKIFMAYPCTPQFQVFCR